MYKLPTCCSVTCVYPDLMHSCYSQKGPPLCSDCHLSYLTNLLMLMFICTGRSFVVFSLQYGFFASGKCNKHGMGSVFSLMPWRGSHGTLIKAFENRLLLWFVSLLIKSSVWSRLAYFSWHIIQLHKWLQEDYINRGAIFERYKFLLLHVFLWQLNRIQSHHLGCTPWAKIYLLIGSRLSASISSSFNRKELMTGYFTVQCLGTYAWSSGI